jgi:hypothetical protein
MSKRLIFKHYFAILHWKQSVLHIRTKEKLRTALLYLQALCLTDVYISTTGEGIH